MLEIALACASDEMDDDDNNNGSTSVMSSVVEEEGAAARGEGEMGDDSVVVVVVVAMAVAVVVAVAIGEGSECPERQQELPPLWLHPIAPAWVSSARRR